MTMIYFIQGRDGTPVKIGYTQYPAGAEGRRRSLQTGYPYDLSILLLIEGDRTAEAAIHRALACDRLRGEWFEWSRRIDQFMTDCRAHGLASALEMITGDGDAMTRQEPSLRSLMVGEGPADRVFQVKFGTVRSLRLEGRIAPDIELPHGARTQRFYYIASLKRALAEHGIQHLCRPGLFCSPAWKILAMSQRKQERARV